MNEPRHTKLKGTLGNLPASALGIWGSGCNALQQWATDISKWFGGQASLCYLDEHHKADKLLEKGFSSTFDGGPASPLLHSNSSVLNSSMISYWSALHELVLFNGHHLTGEHYWLVWDGKKDFPHGNELIEKTVLVCIPTKEWSKVEEIRSKNPKLAQCPILPLEKVPMIMDWLRKWMDQNQPIVNGLILAGGKSERMGRDKATMDFNGLPQVSYLHQVLGTKLHDVFVSTTHDRVKEFTDMGLKTLPDTFTGLGPIGGILSAFQQNPQAAWMVVACDMPSFNLDAVNFLLENRKSSAFASALKSKYGNAPEPLACIWEPAAYTILLQRLAQGLTCPVKALSTLPCHVVEVPNDAWVANVNAPEDVKKITSKIL
jgi:molybdenum cofactor guanylyltransferase